MKNQFGLDDHYFSKKLGELARDASHYTPEEMRRALDSLSDAARHQAGAAARQIAHPQRESSHV